MPYPSSPTKTIVRGASALMKAATSRTKAPTSAPGSRPRAFSHPSRVWSSLPLRAAGRRGGTTGAGSGTRVSDGRRGAAAANA